MAGPDASDGCLLVNSMIEFGGADRDVSRVTERHFTRLRSASRSGLARAVAAGVWRSEDRPRRKANALMGLIMGVLVAVRARLPARRWRRFFAAAAALIDSWRKR